MDLRINIQKSIKPGKKPVLRTMYMNKTLLAIIANSVTQSPTRTLFAMLFCS